MGHLVINPQFVRERLLNATLEHNNYDDNRLCLLFQLQKPVLLLVTFPLTTQPMLLEK